MLHRFSSRNFRKSCDILAATDKDLARIIETYGYPPMWTRPNSFETMVHIILEQQVSLASAKSALEKLREKIIDISPEKLLLLTDEELKACYFSRQKTVYVKNLADWLQRNELDLNKLEKWPDDKVRATITQLKGIGNWTADIYLMFVLQRADIFPMGDLAAVNALKEIKKLKGIVSSEKIMKITEAWRPWRSVATMILWHYYLSKRVKKIQEHGVLPQRRED